MESVVIHGQDTEWEDTKEGVVAGNTSCLRYSNIKMIVEKLTMPGCVFDHQFLETLLLCLPSFSNPLEFFNCLAQHLFPSTPVKNVFLLEQVQTKVLMVLRCWVKNQCAYADMSTGSLLDNMIELMREANKKCAPAIASLARKIKEALKNLRQDLRSIDEAQILYRSRVIAVQTIMSQVMIAHNQEQMRKRANVARGVSDVDTPPPKNGLSSGNSSMNLMEGVIITPQHTTMAEVQGQDQQSVHTRRTNDSNGAAIDSTVNQYENSGTIIHSGSESIVGRYGDQDDESVILVSTDICSSSPDKTSRVHSSSSSYSSSSSSDTIDGGGGGNDFSGSLVPSASVQSMPDHLVRVSEGSPSPDRDGGLGSALPSNLNFDHSMKSEILISRDSMGQLVTVAGKHLNIISRDSMQMLRTTNDVAGGHGDGSEQEEDDEGIDIENLNISGESGGYGGEEVDVGSDNGSDNGRESQKGAPSNHSTSSHTILVEYMSSSAVQRIIGGIDDGGNGRDDGDALRGRTISTSSMASVALDYHSSSAPSPAHGGAGESVNMGGSPLRSQLYSTDPGSLHDRRALYSAQAHSVDASPVHREGYSRLDRQQQLLQEQAYARGLDSPTVTSTVVGRFPGNRGPVGIGTSEELLHGKRSSQQNGSLLSSDDSRRATTGYSPMRSRIDSTSSQAHTQSLSPPPPPAPRFKTRMSYKKLAMMLTIIEYEDALCCIRPREFIGQVWTKKELKGVHPDLGGASILSKFIFNTNQRIAWVAREILNYGLKSSGLSATAAAVAAAPAASSSLPGSTVPSAQSTPQPPAVQLYGSKTPGKGGAGTGTGTAFSPPPACGISSPPITTPKATAPLQSAYDTPGLSSSSSPGKLDNDQATNDCIEYFLLVARACLKMNNFNTVFQIMSALALPAIKNLKAAWSNISSGKKALYRSLVELCSATDNYTNYRMKLAEVANEPKIPCIQVFLRDLTMLDNVGEWRKGGFIDLKKVVLMAHMVRNYLPSKEQPVPVPGQGHGRVESHVGKNPSVCTRYVVEITGTVHANSEHNAAADMRRLRRSGQSPGDAGRSYSSATNTTQRHSTSSQQSTLSQSLANPNAVSFLRYLQLSRDSFFEGLHQDVAEREGSIMYRRELQWSTASVSLAARSQSNIETTPKKSKMSRLFSPLMSLFSGDKTKSSSSHGKKGSGAADDSRWHLIGDDMELAILQQYIQW